MPEIESGHRYVIHNVKGGTVVDLSAGDNKTVTGYPPNGGDNQKWELIRVEHGWNIKNVRTGGYLSFEGSVGNDKRIIASSTPYTWHIWHDEVQTDGYRVCPPNSKHDLDLSDHGNPNPGNPIALWGRWKGLNQVWKFESA